jgi:hypothetical protein
MADSSAGCYLYLFTPPYGARSHYGKTHPSWNPALESELRRDWTASGGQENDWATESQFIRKGWDYKN